MTDRHHNQGRSNIVTGCQISQRGFIGKHERHRHPGHEVFDRLMRDRNEMLVAFDRDYFALEIETFLVTWMCLRQELAPTETSNKEISTNVAQTSVCGCRARVFAMVFGTNSHRTKPVPLSLPMSFFI